MLFGWQGNVTVRLAAGDRHLAAVIRTRLTCPIRAPPVAAPATGEYLDSPPDACGKADVTGGA